MRITFMLLLCLTLTTPVLSSEIKRPGQDLGFVPHKALYEVKLQSAKAGSQVVNIKGHMYYEWTYECEAWSSKHRFNVIYEYADSPAMRISSDFSNFEAYDGSTLNYNVIREQDGKQYEEIRGHARSTKEEQGEAIYNQPAGLIQSLPKDTLYPINHTLETIKAANAGQKFYNAVVFDGSDDDGPVEINAFIGKTLKAPNVLKAAEKNKAIDKALINAKARQIQLAFFPLNEIKNESDYEINLTLHDNSVISDMVIDYDDFAVSQSLIALEPIDPSSTLKACQ